MANLKESLQAYARSIGFDALGVTSAAPVAEIARYRAWIENGHAADMHYLTDPEGIAKRADPSLLLPGAKSILVGAISYAPQTPPPSSDIKFARYAWGEDYHDVVRNRLELLASWLAAQATEPFRYVAFVDSGPVMERSLAARAGLGWIGKNGCLIHENLGSYLVLGELITTLDLPPDAPVRNRCGDCTLCLDACPTRAFAAPGVLDARRCISYQTLENRSPAIPPEIASNMNGRIAGCDICQEVCPWNEAVPPGRCPEFLPLPHTRLRRNEILALDKTARTKLFGNTALKRIKLRNLKRNAEGCLPRQS